MNAAASPARREILERVAAGLGRAGPAPAPAAPAVPLQIWRSPGAPEAETELLLREIAAVGGRVRAVQDRAELASALAELVAEEQVAAATLWRTPELLALGLEEALAALGVDVAPADASMEQIAACELGITGVDAALPETGTLLLRSGPGRPRAVSLLPRVHLALVAPGALRANLRELLDVARGADCATLITGPSRTSDIELTLTIGVHGPKALYVWLVASPDPAGAGEAPAGGR